MNYTYRQIGDTYVVWFAPINRFMHLQKPAFRVMEDWSRQLPNHQIILNCSNEFQQNKSDAHRFVIDVTGLLESLISNYQEAQTAILCNEAGPPPDADSFITRYYRINGKTFRFRFSDPDMEELIHPGFCYLENQTPESEYDHGFDLFHQGDQSILQINGQTTWKCPYSKTENFVGLIFMQMLNCIHNSADSHWMGAVHASTVSAGNGAVLFTAPSGSGKSTFAALLMNKGYQVLSDDFSPISITDPKVYPFPEGISVKNRSLQVLQSYFPSLAAIGESIPTADREAFLPIASCKLPPPAPVKAIVFLQYTPIVEEVAFSRISNLEAMDRFLQQLWLPPTIEVASQFMDWYFQIPCYTLNYSNNNKAIDHLSNLFL